MIAKVATFTSPYLDARPLDQAHDPTERAFRDVLLAANAFEACVETADNQSRAIQLRERIGAAVMVLAAVERAALARVDAL